METVKLRLGRPLSPDKLHRSAFQNRVYALCVEMFADNGIYRAVFNGLPLGPFPRRRDVPWP